MRVLLTVALVLPLAAQTPPDLQSPPTTAPAAAKPPLAAPTQTTPPATETTPAQATTPAPAAAPPAAPAAAQDTAKDTTAAAPSPVPSTEPDISGWIDFGYRWRSGVNGSLETYRSIVNLGSGPKLFGADFTLIDPKKRLFDTMHVLASGWGGDPYGTFHLDASKAKRYRLDADYRDLSYFNNLPSYADPLLTRGIMLDDSYRVAARGSGTASVTPKGTPAFPDRDFSVRSPSP